MSKITKATFKSFVNKNRNKLMVLTSSSFDGMSDMVERNVGAQFKPVAPAEYPCDNNLGLAGVWLTSGSGNSFQAYEASGMRGITVYNCCGESTVAIKTC